MAGLLWLAAMGCVAGCQRGPRAPALEDTPVYQNNEAGFRFLVPDNWTQAASGVLPESKLEGEVLLVKYRMRTSQRGAALEVLCFHESLAADLSAYHAGPSHGIKQWDVVEAATEVDIQGTPAQRMVYATKVGEREMIKEVVAFRRGERIYNFIGLFWSNDPKAREQLRRTLNSTIWR